VVRFEQGPIRPPSEASSLLVRVSRSCPWNRCAFCAVYKGERFSLRTADEVLRDLDALRSVHGEDPRTVFLQDANALLTPVDDLVRILEGVRERFPRVRRITSYARSHTLARRKPEELRRIRRAGLDRLHVGMESGCEAVLSTMQKGCTRSDHVEGGRKAREAGFELSEYVMPGLGGQALSADNADDTASALSAIGPDFVRIRSTGVVPGTPLAEMAARGDFIPLSETETVSEIRRMVAGIASGRLESDHGMNLLVELSGDLPDDRARLLGTCDRYLRMPEDEQRRFVLARRLGWIRELDQLEDRRVQAALDEIAARMDTEGVPVERVLEALRSGSVR